MEQLQEAHEPAAMLDKVKSLHPGEVARLKGGVAVKHMHTEDARPVYKVGRPSSYSDTGDPRYYDSESHGTAEKATQAAFRSSAESTDPASIGGATRLSRYATLHHDGKEVRVHGFTTDGKAVIGLSTGAGPTTEVHPDRLKRPRPVGSILGESLHAVESVVPWGALREEEPVEEDADAGMDALEEVFDESKHPRLRGRFTSKQVLSKAGTSVTTQLRPGEDHHVAYQGKSNLGHRVSLNQGGREHSFVKGSRGWSLNGVRDAGGRQDAPIGAAVDPNGHGELHRALEKALPKKKKVKVAESASVLSFGA